MSQAAKDRQQPGGVWDRWRWIGGLAIAAIAVMRCAIVFAQQRVFDVDPTLSADPVGGLGPAGSLTLDVALLAACAIALIGESFSGRGLRAGWLVLAAIPVPVLILHGLDDARDLWRGSTWAGAVLAAVTLAHLARDGRLRCVLAALLLAAVAPLIVRGGWQVLVEHTATVRQFEQEKDRLIAQFGWEPGSSAAKVYERRLRQPQPTGWFATANVLASVLGCGLVAMLGLALAAARARVGGGAPAAALVAIAACCAAGLWLGGSKGAVAATVAGVALLIAPLVSSRGRAVALRWGGPAAIACVAAVVLGVAARGTLVPESFLGDRSLLFRWHYTVGSARIIAAEPWLGIGPSGFQQAYVAVRPERSPEEVMAAHNVAWDWLAALGVSGAAWLVLAGWMTWRAGSSLGAPPRGTQERPAMAALLACAALVAGAGLVPALLTELHTLSRDGMAIRMAGIVAYFALAGGLGVVMTSIDSAVARWSLACGAITLMMHCQIEMTLVQPGAAVWGLGVLGVAAAAPEGGVRRRWAGLVAGGGLALGAAWLHGRGAAPAARQEEAMIAAARVIAEARDPQAAGAARQRAAELLLAAYAFDPSNVTPLDEASDQFQVAAGRPGAAASLSRYERAADAAQRAWRRHGRLSSLSLLAHGRRGIATISGLASDWDAAIDAARELARRDPNGLSAAVRLGDMLWDSGRPMEAAEAYRRALAISDNHELDELKQLSARDRARLESRIGEPGPGSVADDREGGP